MSNKSYESYEMLAKLLNSENKENIDRAYNALSEALAQSYRVKKDEVSAEFDAKRNALAANRAKAEKYLDYFMTEKGYSGSGIEADAKLKSNLSYNADLAGLSGAEAAAIAKLDSEQAEAERKNEAEKNEKLAEEGKDLQDRLYKAASDSAQLELKEKELESDNYFKQQAQDYNNAQLELKKKELEFQDSWKKQENALKTLQAEAQAAEAAAKVQAQTVSSAQKKEIDELNGKVDSYRSLMYADIKNKFAASATADEMQAIYDSVTGVNAESAFDIFGEKLYSTLVKDFSKKLGEQRAKEEHDKRVDALYYEFVNAKDEYHNETYRRLRKKITFDAFSGYTLDELDEAYKLYKKGL